MQIIEKHIQVNDSVFNKTGYGSIEVFSLERSEYC